MFLVAVFLLLVVIYGSLFALVLAIAPTRWRPGPGSRASTIAPGMGVATVLVALVPFVVGLVGGGSVDMLTVLMALLFGAPQFAFFAIPIVALWALVHDRKERAQRARGDDI